MRAIGKPPWPKNPQYCAACFRVVTRMHAGAEVDCSVLFADVRGSTTIAEGMRPAAYRGLMAGFFRTATQILVDHDAIVDKFVGDEVVALFIPALTGSAHAERAIAAGRALIAAMSGRQDGNSLPIGAGVHTGVAFVGSVGDGDASDFTAMGDPVNVAARLASAAHAGEVLVTVAAAAAAGLATSGLEHRSLDLKGKTEPVDVVVVRAA
jgi:adenylate cyclase